MDEKSVTDLLQNEEKAIPKLPSGLNVLTILTFIGCAFSGLFLIFSNFIYKLLLKFMDKAIEADKEMPAKKLAELQKGKDSIELLLANLIPMVVIGLAGVALCFMGALWMRKLKKEGFWLYVAGEIVPVILGFIIMGSAQTNSVMSIAFGLGLPVAFVVLYAAHRKYLVY